MRPGPRNPTTWRPSSREESTLKTTFSLTLGCVSFFLFFFLNLFLFILFSMALLTASKGTRDCNQARLRLWRSHRSGQPSRQLLRERQEGQDCLQQYVSSCISIPCGAHPH